MATRNAIVLGTFITTCCVAATFAAPPSTTQSSSIRATLKAWNRIPPELNLDDALKVFSANTEKEKRLAQDMAAQWLAVTRIRAAVRAKWGDEAANKIVSACGSDSDADDDAAEEIVKGDHAMLRFKNENVAPIFLVTVGGDWKVDCAAYVQGLGDQFPDAQRTMNSISAIIQTAHSGLISGKFKDVPSLEASLKKQIAALDSK